MVIPCGLAVGFERQERGGEDLGNRTNLERGRRCRGASRAADNFAISIEVLFAAMIGRDRDAHALATLHEPAGQSGHHRIDRCACRLRSCRTWPGGHGALDQKQSRGQN
jgi:hypothetical protein